MTTVDLTSQIQAAIDAINGAATFDEKEIIDETIVETTYLILPYSGLYEAQQVENITKKRNIPKNDIITIVYMNYVHLIANGVAKDKAIKIALVRAGIVANGGYFPDENDVTKAAHTYRSEIKFLKDPDVVAPLTILFRDAEGNDKTMTYSADLIATLKADKREYTVSGITLVLPPEHTDFPSLMNAVQKETLTKMIKYLPILAHMAFVKFEHHYIDNAYFKESYAKQFKSLKMFTEEAGWNHADVIYPSVHWMGPYVMRKWCENLLAEDLMPRPLSIKFPLIPAGTALICSTVAVLNAAGAIPGFNAFYEVYATQWNLMTQAVHDIKLAPYKFHTRADLFDEDSAEDSLNPAKNAAAQLAPAAQAFINRYAQGTDLARIQAIKKHAQNNLGLLRRYEAIFAGNAVQARTAARVKPMRELIEGTTGKDLIPPVGMDEDV